MNTPPRIIIPGPTPVPGFALDPSPEVERMTIHPQEIPAPPSPPSPRDLERAQPAPDDLTQVPMTARLIVACAAARDLLSRSLNTQVVVDALLQMRHTRTEAETAVRLVLYMKRK